MKAFWILCTAFALILLFAFVTNMYFITSGAVLGVFMLFAVGFGYVLSKNWIKRIIMFGPIAWVLDLGLSWGITYGLGYSVTGFTAGIVFGLLVSMVIHFEQNRFKMARRGY